MIWETTCDWDSPATAIDRMGFPPLSVNDSNCDWTHNPLQSAASMKAGLISMGGDRPWKRRWRKNRSEARIHAGLCGASVLTGFVLTALTSFLT